MKHLPTAYLVICALAFGVFVAGLPAIAGDDADPLAGVFMYLVALPWILVLNLFDEVPIAATLAAAIAGMAINFLILRWLVRRRDNMGGA